jgi:hypothetical protein
MLSLMLVLKVKTDSEYHTGSLFFKFTLLHNIILLIFISRFLHDIYECFWSGFVVF